MLVCAARSSHAARNRRRRRTQFTSSAAPRLYLFLVGALPSPVCYAIPPTLPYTAGAVHRTFITRTYHMLRTITAFFAFLCAPSDSLLLLWHRICCSAFHAPLRTRVAHAIQFPILEGPGEDGPWDPPPLLPATLPPHMPSPSLTRHGTRA